MIDTAYGRGEICFPESPWGQVHPLYGKGPGTFDKKC